MNNLYIFEKIIALVRKGYIIRFSSGKTGTLEAKAYRHGKLIYSVEYTYTSPADDDQLRDLLHHIALALALKKQ